MSIHRKSETRRGAIIKILSSKQKNVIILYIFFRPVNDLVSSFNQHSAQKIGTMIR